MRVVREQGEFKDAFSRAVSEAKSAFGDGTVFIERFLERPRHIEVQILADAEGNVVLESPPKEKREFTVRGQSRDYVLEDAIFADFALVRAAKGDRHGNLVFRKATRQFGPPAAMAGRVCIAQVEELVEPGEIDPDEVHLPGVFVHRIVEVGTDIEKRIEKRTVRASGEES